MQSDGASGTRDLILLVADGTMAATCKGLLSRPEALGIRSLSFQVLPHPEHDPGVFHRAPEFLRSFESRFRRALVLLDHEGSGQESVSRQEMEEALEERLEQDWGKGRCGAVVLEPELEAWVWSDSPHVPEVLGWRRPSRDLREWLVEEGHLAAGESKPARPKEAMATALRIARKPRSSALYRQLAERVSLRGCKDPSFTRFCEILRGWFPPMER